MLQANQYSLKGYSGGQLTGLKRILGILIYNGFCHAYTIRNNHIDIAWHNPSHLANNKTETPDVVCAGATIVSEIEPEPYDNPYHNFGVSTFDEHNLTPFGFKMPSTDETREVDKSEAWIDMPKFIKNEVWRASCQNNADSLDNAFTAYYDTMKVENRLA